MSPSPDRRKSLPEDFKTIAPNGRMKLVSRLGGAPLNSTILKGARREILSKENPNPSACSGFPTVLRWWIPTVLLVCFGGVQPGCSISSPSPSRICPIRPFPPRCLRKNKKRSAEQVRRGAEGGRKNSPATELPALFFRDTKYPDTVVSHVIAIIQTREGLVTIHALTEKLGYSRRYHEVRQVPRARSQNASWDRSL